MANIVVIGYVSISTSRTGDIETNHRSNPSAGVSGLTSALLLARKGHAVTVISKHMPGDYDIEYTSPWAGANMLP